MITAMAILEVGAALNVMCLVTRGLESSLISPRFLATIFIIQKYSKNNAVSDGGAVEKDSEAVENTQKQSLTTAQEDGLLQESNAKVCR